MTASPGFMPKLDGSLVFDALRDPVVAADVNDVVVYCNAALSRLLGWSAHDLVGQKLAAIMPARFRAAHHAGFRRFVTTHRGKMMGRPVRVPALHRDGHEVDVELTLSELAPAAGEMLIIAVLRDMRERIELEAKVASQRKILAQYAAVTVLAEATTTAEAMPKLLRATAEALSWEMAAYWELHEPSQRLALSSTWSSDPELGETFFRGCRDVTFGPNEGLPGQVLATRAPLWSKDVRSDDRYVRARIAAEHGVRSALLFPIYSGTRTWGVFEYLTRHEEEPDDELLQTMASLGFQVGQFFERMAVEQQLRQALAQAQAEKDNLHSLLMQAPAAIAIVKGPDLRYELSNPKNQLLAGGRHLLGRTLLEAFPEAEAAGTLAVLRHVYATGETYIGKEHPVIAPAGNGHPERLVYMNGIMQPLRNGEGAVEGVMVFAYDVTELVHARERVEDARERMRLAMDVASIGSFEFDLQAQTIRCDDRYRQLFGLPESENITYAMLTAALHPDDRGQVLDAIAAALNPDGVPDVEVDHRVIGVRDGVERWVHMRARTFFDGGRTPLRIVGTGIDVTPQRRALERLKFMADASTILSANLDDRSTLEQVAAKAVPAFADLCFFEIVDQAGAMQRVATATATPELANALQVLRAGSPTRQEVPSAVALVQETRRPHLWEDLSEAQLRQLGAAEEDLCLLGPLQLHSAMVLPLLSRNRVIGAMGFVQCGSGRRYGADDLAFAEEVARRSAMAVENARLYDQAIAAVGIRDQFLSIASHELKTPLSSITLQLSMLRRLLESGKLLTLPPDNLVHRFSVMTKQADRLTKLIEELLDVSRIASGRLALAVAQTDLVEVVREAVAGLEDEARHKGGVLQFDSQGPVFGMWDASRLDQVVVNLVENAIKYGGDGTSIRIVVEACGDKARLSVQDQGPGIAAEDQPRIFDQFERAASPNLGGLGLGLWITRRIVEAHKGTISVHSQPGAGSTFIVELPLGALRRTAVA